MNPSPPSSSTFDSRRFTYALLCVLLGPGAVTLAVQSLFGNRDLATMYVSAPLWESLLTRWGGAVDPLTQTAVLPFFPLLGYLLALALVTWLAGGFLISRFRQTS